MEMKVRPTSKGRGPIPLGILRALIPAAAFLIALLFARYTLATTFQTYDDEGHLLLSLDHYLRGEKLYADVASMYGPFCSWAQAAMFHLLRLPVSHDAGRLVTLILWMLSAVLGGYFVYSMSRNVVLASAATLACARLAAVLANEPGHPQQLILPIFFLACCAAAPGGSRPLRLLLMGVLGAALLFTKINIGLFYLVALAYTLICQFPPGRIRTLGVGLMFAWAIVSPSLLMRRDLPHWAFGYCFLATLSGATAFLAGSLNLPACPQPMRKVLYAAAGLLSAATVIVAGTMLQGLSFHALMDGILWGPLRNPGLFSVPLWISREKMLSGLLASAGAAALYLVRDRKVAHPDLVDALRCTAGLFAAVQLAFWPHRIGWIVPLLPLGVIPTPGRGWRWPDLIPRLFTTSLAATEFMEAYPVAGSQLAIAAAPLLIWAFICIHDGTGGFVRLVGRVMGSRPRRLKESAIGGLLAVVLGIAMFHPEPLTGGYAYPASRLPGAASLHLRPELEARFLFLANAVAANCDLLFTMPGMGSLNYWSRTPTPNGSNLTAWMMAFSLQRQLGILDILIAHPGSCSVDNLQLVDLWGVKSDQLSGSPLANYVINGMRKVAEKDGYAIRVHPGRVSPWITTAVTPGR